MTPEEKARQQIDAQLLASGWAVQTKDKINLSAARGVAVCELSFATGEPDYTLFVDTKSLGIVEAKPAGHSLVGVEEQSTKYVTGVLTPFADSLTERFNEWLMDQAKAAVVAGRKSVSSEQLAWLNLIRDHIATAISIEPEDLELSPFNQRGGLGRAHQLFGEQRPKLLDELNAVLAA